MRKLLYAMFFDYQDEYARRYIEFVNFAENSEKNKSYLAYVPSTSRKYSRVTLILKNLDFPKSLGVLLDFEKNIFGKLVSDFFSVKI